MTGRARARRRGRQIAEPPRDRAGRTPGPRRDQRLARTNLTLPADLLEEVDALAGPRGRSRYVAEAVAQRVRRDRLGRALRETTGIMAGTPDSMTREQVSAWVDRLRSEETD